MFVTAELKKKSDLMYREYRDMPVVNRTCTKATQDRAYQKHLEALQKTKATINTSAPQVPRTVGLNMKKYENEKQRNEEIAKDNLKLYNDIEKIQNRKKSPHQSPQTHFTLRGQYQVEQAEQIDRENRKLVNALVNQKPNIKRTDFYYHNCDHLYQVNKMSIHKKTVPMSQIMRQKLPPMENPSEPKSTRQRAPRKIPHLDSNKAPSTSRDNLFVTNKGNSDQLLQVTGKDSINQEGHQCDMKCKSDEINDVNSGLLLGKVYDDDEEEEEWNDEFIESTEPTDSKGKLDQILDGNANILAGSKDESKGKLDQITDDNLGMLIGNKKEDQDNSDNDDDIGNEDDDPENDQSDHDDIDNEDDDQDTNQSDHDDQNDDDDQDDNSNSENRNDTDEDSSNKQDDQSESKGELDDMANNQFKALMGNNNESTNEKSDDKKGKLDNLASNNFNNLMGANNKSDDDNGQELEDDDQDDDSDDDTQDNDDDDLDNDDQNDDLDNDDDQDDDLDNDDED